MELTNSDGAFYHFWFPKCSGEELKSLKEKAKRAAYKVGDVVGFTFDWIPDWEIDCELESTLLKYVTLKVKKLDKSLDNTRETGEKMERKRMNDLQMEFIKNRDYISRSEYRDLLDRYTDVEVLLDANDLEEYERLGESNSVKFVKEGVK